ncbi:runt domain-containing protein [Ditylenchus destructor]|nr:runt domain-containing protein [Ditylenchus destructor]
MDVWLSAGVTIPLLAASHQPTTTTANPQPIFLAVIQRSPLRVLPSPATTLDMCEMERALDALEQSLSALPTDWEFQPTGSPNVFCTTLPKHWRSNKSLPVQFAILVLHPVADGTKVSVAAGNEENCTADVKNNVAEFSAQMARFSDLRFVGKSGRGKNFNLTITINAGTCTEVVIMNNVIKVTVDGPRDSRNLAAKCLSGDFSRKRCGSLAFSGRTESLPSTSHMDFAKRFRFSPGSSTAGLKANPSIHHQHHFFNPLTPLNLPNPRGIRPSPCGSAFSATSSGNNNTSKSAPLIMFPNSPPGLPPLFFPPLDPMVNMSRSGSAPVPISYIGSLCDIFSGHKGVNVCSTASGMSSGTIHDILSNGMHSPSKSALDSRPFPNNGMSPLLAPLMPGMAPTIWTSVLNAAVAGSSIMSPQVLLAAAAMSHVSQNHQKNFQSQQKSPIAGGVFPSNASSFQNSSVSGAKDGTGSDASGPDDAGGLEEDGLDVDGIEEDGIDVDGLEEDGSDGPDSEPMARLMKMAGRDELDGLIDGKRRKEDGPRKKTEVSSKYTSDSPPDTALSTSPEPPSNAAKLRSLSSSPLLTQHKKVLEIASLLKEREVRQTASACDDYRRRRRRDHPVRQKRAAATKVTDRCQISKTNLWRPYHLPAAQPQAGSSTSPVVGDH